MRRLTRLILPLVLAQALCLALGLWLQDRFVDSMETWETQSELAVVEESAAGSETPDAITTEVTAESSPEHQSQWPIKILAFAWIIGLQAGAAYLIISRENTEHVRQQRARHEESLHKSRELVQTRDAVVFGLAKLAESRDPETGQHLERIAMYSTRLANALRQEPAYRNEVSSSFVKLIGISSALHDIGKVGVRDSILLKKGPLSQEERETMQEHVEIGGNCINEIERRLGNSNFLEMAREIAFFHHERWDGGGYGEGLKAEEIPLAARIVSIADVYDALRSERVYKKSYPHQKCVDIIVEQTGRQFDPGLIKVFQKIESQFNEISIRFSDQAESRKASKAAQGTRAAAGIIAAAAIANSDVLQGTVTG